MYKYYLLIFSIMFIFGCTSDFDRVETITKKYPKAQIYHIYSDEYIIIEPNNSIRFIELDFTQIIIDMELKQVVGYIKEIEQK